MADCESVNKEMDVIGKFDFAVISIAVLAMSTARYWTF